VNVLFNKAGNFWDYVMSDDKRASTEHR
jgi:hypothetical protein